MNTDHLTALTAVVDTGSFEGAARALHVTASAVSQRIKALEKRHGRVLVVRSTPCRPTPDGEVLLRLARQVAELEGEALAQLDPVQTGRRHLPVVVNADSLATWFESALTEIATWDDIALRLFIEVEDLANRYLRTGEAVGAVTSDPVPVPGCTVEPLGTLRYLCVAAPWLLGDTAPGDIDWQTLPMMRFNGDDDLQHRVLARHGVTDPEVQHFIPSPHGYLAGVRAGLGWGLIPEAQIGTSLRTGDLVLLDERPLDVHLSWQSWRLGSEPTDRLAAAVRRAAARGLHRPA